VSAAAHQLRAQPSIPPRPSRCFGLPAFPGPAQPPCARRFEPLTRGARVSAATSRRWSNPRPSRGRARGRPRLGFRATSPQAHGSARLGLPPYKVAATLSCESPVAETLVAQRRCHPLPPPLTRASVTSRRQAAASASPSLGKGASSAT
jgi:hypothetical protein